MKRTLASLVCLLATCSPSWAQLEGLGRIEFPTSATGEAQAVFVRGVLLLHSFEYEDARDEFVRAQGRSRAAMLRLCPPSRQLADAAHGQAGARLGAQ